jgi:hypothetical protein
MPVAVDGKQFSRQFLLQLQRFGTDEPFRRDISDEFIAIYPALKIGDATQHAKDCDVIQRRRKPRLATLAMR